jgi:predicted NBD/HSP70 family sugar kinase
MQFGSGHRYGSFFYLLITAALGGGLVVDGGYFRGAHGRSGEIGWLHDHDAFGRDMQLQNIVSLSALYSRLADGGYRVSSPRRLARLGAGARIIVDGWIRESTEALVKTMVAINCLINPEAILIGGRLPAALVDQLFAWLILPHRYRISHPSREPSRPTTRRPSAPPFCPSLIVCFRPASRCSRATERRRFQQGFQRSDEFFVVAPALDG